MFYTVVDLPMSLNTLYLPVQPNDAPFAVFSGSATEQRLGRHTANWSSVTRNTEHSKDFPEFQRVKCQKTSLIEEGGSK